MKRERGGERKEERGKMKGNKAKWREDPSTKIYG